MDIWQWVALSFLAEIIEISWQYAPQMGQVIDRLWRLYSRSVFLLLLAHTGYLYILYISLRFDLLNWPIIVAIALKTLDIFTKIEMVRKIYIRHEVDELSRQMLNMQIPLLLWAIGPLSYPYLVWLALTHISV